MVQHKRQQQQEQGNKPWHAQLALLLLLVAASIPQAAAIRLRLPPSRHLLVLGQLGAHADSVAYVANASGKADAGITRPTITLLEALQDPEVTHMILLTNYTVGKNLQQALYFHPCQQQQHAARHSLHVACSCQSAVTQHHMITRITGFQRSSFL
jgi:hypothetical protein